MANNFSKLENAPRGWHSRGYLPHFDGGEICQFITLHLGDALPREVVERWRLELEREKDEKAKIELHKRIENYLDKGYGECYLGKQEIAGQVQESLLHFDAVRYKLIAWVVMPNHTHFLIKPINSNSLSEIMKKFKSFTAHEANKILRRSGQFWQEDYFDRYIRNREHFENTIDYIENNPVKAGLCKRRSDWRFSSSWSADGSSA
ncbi:MAG: REP-associated tyrosine transposase [Pyrinomonadaceae bacterium]